jgi:hypothetical protein
MNCEQFCEKFRKAQSSEQKAMWRPHLTCLTCWWRRWYYKKRGWEGLTRKKKVIMVMESVNPLGTIMPKKPFFYFIVMKYDHDGTWWVLRNAIVKRLLSLAEFFAQL